MMKRGMHFFVMLLCCVGAVSASSKHQEFSDFTTPMPLKAGDVLVLGIVGGWERWDAERIVRLTALGVREKNYPGVYAETVENHSLHLARELLTRTLDLNGDGSLSEAEKQQARLILYGQSLGGSAAVRFARELQAQGIPILLLLVIDSYGDGDEVVPSNVKAAMNLYQRDHLFIKGEDDFIAEDPTKTLILGNRRYWYRGKDADDLESRAYQDEGWLRRVFIGSHLKMEYDREVRDLVMRTVLNHIPADRKTVEALEIKQPTQ